MVYADWMNQVATWARLPIPVLGANISFPHKCRPTEGTEYRRFRIYLVDVFDNMLPLCVQTDGTSSSRFRAATPKPPVISSRSICRGPTRLYCRISMPVRGSRRAAGAVKKRVFIYHFCYRGTGGEWDRVDGP
jgi:hypothetical protein